MAAMGPGRARAHYALAAAAVIFALWTFVAALVRDVPPKGTPWVGIAALAIGAHLVAQVHVQRSGSRLAVLAILLPLGAVGAAAVAAFTDW